MKKYFALLSIGTDDGVYYNRLGCYETEDIKEAALKASVVAKWTTDDFVKHYNPNCKVKEEEEFWFGPIEDSILMSNGEGEIIIVVNTTEFVSQILEITNVKIEVLLT